MIPQEFNIGVGSRVAVAEKGVAEKGKTQDVSTPVSHRKNQQRVLGAPHPPRPTHERKLRARGGPETCRTPPPLNMTEPVTGCLERIGRC